jgi:nucleoside 2-deoxyribosyltransferase
MAQVQGLAIYWPYRDTNQQDPSGLRICKDNRKAIEESDIVFVYWDGLSQGSLFDLGMAFAFRKRIIPLSLPQLTPGKSFQNMVIDWVFQGPG